MFIDLAELPTLFDIHPLWSSGRLNIAYFRRRDHFGDPGIPIDQAVADQVENQLGRRPEGPIRMLTHLRYFGLCFNPVSFFFCYNHTDTDVETIVTEIHNTPWNERHCYVLKSEANQHPLKQWRRYRFTKSFHVSPFIDMDIQYDWRFRLPGDRLGVHMIDYQGKNKIFDASLSLRRREITPAALTNVLIKYPLLTGKVVAMIYWQALRLVIKKVPFFPHPKKRNRPADFEDGVIR